MGPNIKSRLNSVAWNKIDGEGASVLFAALRECDSVLALDVSWNSIGGFPVPHPNQVKGVDAMAIYLHHTSSLFHINLSANKFSIDDVEKLSSALVNNRNGTIKGVHFDRNPFGKIDSKGYLVVIPEEQQKEAAVNLIHEHYKHRDALYTGSICWCCGQWIEVEFEYVRGASEAVRMAWAGEGLGSGLEWERERGGRLLSFIYLSNSLTNNNKQIHKNLL